MRINYVYIYIYIDVEPIRISILAVQSTMDFLSHGSVAGAQGLIMGFHELVPEVIRGVQPGVPKESW